MSEQVTRFGPIEVAYDDDVLEPRPWTVEQSRWAVELSGSLPDGPVLELCAGAGQIGLVVAVETGRRLVQVDVDDGACAFARRNATTAGVASDVRCGGLGDAVAGDERFPLVLADPPYIPSDEVDELPEDPDTAVDGGDDGLDVARECLAVAAAHLVDGGRVVLQVASGEQAAALRPSVQEHGLDVVEVRTIGHEGALVLLAPQA